jgi:sulfatase modifying factor 1
MLSEGRANFGCRLKRTSQIDLFPANAFGLHDMHGNVWEWCQDRADGKTDQEGDIKDPQRARSGTARVQRGGSWYNGRETCRAAARCRNDPTSRYSNFGFRVCIA